MKEIISIIRMNNVNQTKKALEAAGFPSLTCRKVLGRGKNAVDYEIAAGKAIPNENSEVLNGELASVAALRLRQIHTLMPKRLIKIVVHDDEVQKIVDVILDANSKGHPGDGKIFVLDIDDAIRIRTMEKGEAAL